MTCHPAITLENISLTLGDKTILNNVSTHFNSGQLTALLGPNGTGKSSLLKIITQEWKSPQGKVFYYQRPASEWAPEVLARHLGVLPQSSSLSFNFKVREVVELGGIPLSINKANLEEVARENMALTDVSHLTLRRYPSLSGGEKQRVHLARVMTQLAQCGQQCILLLDEPTSALDLSHQHKTLALAKKRAEEGASVIIVLHDLNLAAQYADRLVMLNQGNIIADGTPWEVLTPELISSVYDWQAQVIPHPSKDFPMVVS
ncbi:heme ABC transporter ATP-binding protein [Vibrio sp. 10N.286.49.B3]|uniref:heme ABC transporter ATP-binding protein n=1 Tax=Vibrio sp. 10N.286.49.B3 TaxID=1880855 RepID=UPI000CB0B725|nr:heme ABC transporter ATP-binding protein [Vibrio sp. 10N.286.49.B3]PMH37098.1 heme ABC transporter ATP-binding protein [Vibrio sp. 10N.286.49.B3]